MAYKLTWNKKLGKFETVGWDPHEGVEPSSNLVGANDGVYSDVFDYGGMALMAKDAINQHLAAGNFRVIKCKACGLYFILKKKDEEWFKKNDIPAPKRCKCCREARKRAEYYAAVKECAEEGKARRKENTEKDQ